MEVFAPPPPTGSTCLFALNSLATLNAASLLARPSRRAWGEKLTIHNVRKLKPRHNPRSGMNTETSMQRHGVSIRSNVPHGSA